MQSCLFRKHMQPQGDTPRLFYIITLKNRRSLHFAGSPLKLIFISRPCKQAASAQLSSPMCSTITPRVLKRSCNSDETWTPSALLAFDDTMEMEEFGLTRENTGGPVHVFNACIESLADAVGKPRIDPLESQVACWGRCPKAERSAVIQKTAQVCQLMCDVIAPRDGEQLFQAVIDQHNNKTEH